MKKLRLHTKTFDVIEAKNTWSRARGLLGRRDLPATETMWIQPCNGIHTFFMRFAIDIICVDKNLRVQEVRRNIPAWRMTLPRWGVHSTFEFKAGALNDCDINEGDQLHVDP